jgi:hypothetical protein
MSETSNKAGSHLSRLPFNSGDGVTRYCVAGVMTAAPDVDDQWSIAAPSGTGTVAPTYCVDCMGDLGCAEQVYGQGAQKCMQCGSVFLAHG